MWDINQLARAKEYGGWGVGSCLGALKIGTERTRSHKTGSGAGNPEAKGERKLGF